MRTRVITRSLWIADIALACGVAALAWWVVRTRPPGFPPLPVLEASQRPASQDPSPATDVRPLSADELQRVYQRSFAPVSGPTGPAPEEPPAPSQLPEARVPTPQPETPLTPERLPLSRFLRLAAVFHSPDPLLSSIVVENRTKENVQELYWHGQTIDGVPARVVRIEKDAAWFRYGEEDVALRVRGRAEDAGTAEPEEKRPGTGARDPSAAPSRSHYTVPRETVQQAMAKPLDALSGIRYGLVRRDDQIEGVRLLRVDPSSLPAQYGLQEGDIVRAVNGRLLDKTFNPLEMVPQLIKATTVRVQIRRDDKDLELTYELK